MIALLLYVLVSVLHIAISSVTVDIPISSQLPLIARVDQPYSWSFSPLTFKSTDGPLQYTVSDMPSWLSFDGEKMTFHGTPSTTDEGTPEMKVTAISLEDSASSSFNICVTHYPSPSINIPIINQFHANNPSLSSVFVMQPGSVLATSNPALRIPPKWSFSIGFDGNTFKSASKLFYDARLANGQELLEWMTFKPNAMTLNGVVPNDTGDLPRSISLVLIGSDQEGFMALSLPFDIVIARNDVSCSTALRAINVTASTSFRISFLSSADYNGVFVDGMPISVSDVSSLSIDTTGYDLEYDQASRTLSGSLNASMAGQNISLPVLLETTFNQIVKTSIPVYLVPSFFMSTELSMLKLWAGDKFQVDLHPYFSNATIDQQHDVDLTMDLDLSSKTDWLKFDSENEYLSGTVPENVESAHLTVFFTAFSRLTHSTSHISLPVEVLSLEDGKKLKPGAHSANPHTKSILGLSITFGILGGICIICAIFAAIRRCARVEDTALTGEAGQSGWNEKDRRWYGIGLSPRISGTLSRLESGHAPRPGIGTKYGNLGLGLQRVSDRTYSKLTTDGSLGNPQSPGVMRKREFMTRIRETVRRVSEKYSQRQQQRRSPKRPIIGKPIRVTSVRPVLEPDTSLSISPSNPFEGPGIQSHPGSTVLTGSPSTSTAEHSIPRRRADFAPPRSPAQVHFEDGQLIRQPSSGSTGSLKSSGTRISEYNIQTFKDNSIRSVRSNSGLSQNSFTEVATRPRLVPFTSSTRVPVPRLSPGAIPAPGQSYFEGKRITSQKAKVHKPDQDEVEKSGSGDELTIGLHYVRSLGADLPTNARPSSPLRNSVDIGGDGDARETDVLKMVIKVGEKFRFQVPVPSISLAKAHKLGKTLQVKLASGMPLPKFLHVDINGLKTKGIVEFYGTGTTRDVGESVICIFNEAGEACLTKIILEVIGRK